MKIKKNKIISLNIFFMLSMVVPYIFVFAIILADFFSRKNIFKFFIYKSLPFFILLLILLIISMIRGNENFMIYHHTRDYIVFVVISLYLTAICQKENSGAKSLYLVMKNTFVILAIVKILILLYVNIFGANMPDVLDFIKDKIGIPMMQSTSLNDFVFRLQFPTEAVLPFLIYFVIREINQKFTYKATFQLLLLLISLLLTMSRAFWAVGILFIFLSIFLETSSKSKIKIFIASITLIPLFVWVTNIHTIIFSIIQTRFGQNAKNLNYYSDLERIIQNQKLWEKFYENPFFGKGLGYYIPNLIRDENDKYMYESQVLSYLMDFGIIFFSIFIILVLFICFSINLKKYKSLFLSLVFFLFWLIFSSYNPLLLGMSGAILIVFAFNANKFSELQFKY